MDQSPIDTSSTLAHAVDQMRDAGLIHPEVSTVDDISAARAVNIGQVYDRERRLLAAQDWLRHTRLGDCEWDVGIDAAIGLLNQARRSPC